MGDNTDELPPPSKLPNMIFAQIPVMWDTNNKANVTEANIMFSSQQTSDFKNILDYTATLSEKLKSGGKSLRHSKRKRKNKSRNKR